MALVEPVLRQYGLQKLRNVRFRGGNLLGTAIGTAIGLGYGLLKDYEFGLPGRLQPRRTYRSVPYVDEAQRNGSSNRYSQALRSQAKYRTRKRSRKHNRGCCCCC